MTAYRGEIWLANLNPVKRNNEVGKVRPVLILQNDTLNESAYPTTIILPLSTSLIDDAKPLRVRITKREKLQSDSDVLISQVRAIDKSRLIEYVGRVSDEEMRSIKACFDELIEV